MNNKKQTPLIVPKEILDIDFISKIQNEKYIKIDGIYKLTKNDYNNIIVYTNVEKIDVYDIEDFEYQNEIKINIEKKLDFKSDKFKKLNINKIQAKEKTQLTLTLPFNLFFQNDCLYNEEDDFNILLNYLKNIEILNINLEENNIDKLIEVVYKIENKMNKKIKFINCIIENKTIKEIEKLKFLEDGRIIKIWYEDGITDCTIDEFIIMRKNIDLIVNNVKSKKLSNFENIIYVYDIVKKFNYTKSSDNYSMNGRQLHKIFNTNNILCTGYAKIIKQVLNELGIQAGIYKLVTKNNELHTRNLVHIIDEKYDINCIYSMDPTWESAMKEEYAYSLFLTPITDLKKSFPQEKFRKDIDVLCKTTKIDEIPLRDKISLYQFFNNIDLTQEDIENLIINANKKVSLEKFCEALINVKTSTGISKKTIELNVNKIINYNNDLTKYLNKNMGTEINFF